MIAKAVFVTADLQSHIISAQAVFADSILQADADLINRITEGNPRLQEKEITPSEEEQAVLSDIGYAGLNKVVVHAIPNNYGLVSRVGTALVIS